MKTINTYITEKLIINKDTSKYSYTPNTYDDLFNFLKEKLIDHGRKRSILNLNDINISKIDNLSGLFFSLELRHGCHVQNIDISEWDVSNVTNMDNMFRGCKNFNCDLSNWDVKNLVNAQGMFMGCEKFESDLSSWNTVNLNNMVAMFSGCEKLSFNIDDWPCKNTFKKDPKKCKWYKTNTKITGDII